VRKLILFLLVSLLIGAVAVSASAEIYKYVDADGQLRFTDDPNAAGGAEAVQLRPTNTISSGTPSRSQKVKPLPAATKFPKVELFVTSWCGYCKKAEAYLQGKGVPFTVYDIEKDLQAARRKDSLTSKRGVPFALIGDQRLTGFSESAYERALQTVE